MGGGWEEHSAAEEIEEERGGEERWREAVGDGQAGSQRASRSGLLSNGTEVRSPPGVGHFPLTPVEEEERRKREEEIRGRAWRRPRSD